MSFTGLLHTALRAFVELLNFQKAWWGWLDMQCANKFQLWSNQSWLKKNNDTFSCCCFLSYSLKEGYVIGNYTKTIHPRSLSFLSFMKTHKGYHIVDTGAEYLFLFWVRKGTIKLSLSYHGMCFPVFEEKQDYSISPAQKRQTMWIPWFCRAPPCISCFLCFVVTSDS
jgi:hypothetical protein